MRITKRKRWFIAGGAFGAGVAAVVTSAFVVFVGAGVAASAAQPRNTVPPTISGTPQEGSTLTGNRGEWSNNPNDFDYFWLRCDRTGGSCATISGANTRSYRLTSADVGNTVRFRVRASNADGSTSATSVPTAVIQRAPTAPPPPPPTPSRGSGCPSGSGNPDQVASISPPARLLVDRLQAQPSVVPGSAQSFTIRFHVTSTCTGDVQGALVYATATPFNMVSIPPETPTGSDGWVELRFNDINFPITSRQQILAIFVRARKPGESLLGGISTRRLVSVRVNARA
jgi:hypothetical protein